MREILLVSAGRSLGGTERVLLDSARRLVARGERVRAAVSPDAGVDPLAAALEAAGVRVARWDEVRSPRDAVRAARDLRRWAPRLLHAHLSWPHANAWLAAAARWTRVPAVVATEHLRLPEDHLRDDLRKRALAPLINRTIAVSTAIAEHLTRRWGYRPSRVAVIPNGVDLDLFRGPDPEIRARARHRLGVDGDAFLVGSVGRLEAQKGFVHLIRAAGALAGAAPDLRLAIAGEGSLAGALRDEARALAIGDRLLLAGRVDDAAEFLAALDLFVLPSLWEGMPLSLLEAMAMGVPCVATATAGSAEVLAVADAEPAGDTVPPADERALAAAIAAHRRDRERSRRVGRAGLARVRERHDAARLFDRLVSLYDELAPPAAS